MLFQEHFLSNGNHLDKDEFLSQMALYANASSTYLEPVSAAFFAKVFQVCFFSVLIIRGIDLDKALLFRVRLTLG